MESGEMTEAELEAELARLEEEAGNLDDSTIPDGDLGDDVDISALIDKPMAPAAKQMKKSRQEDDVPADMAEMDFSADFASMLAPSNRAKNAPKMEKKRKSVSEKAPTKPMENSTPLFTQLSDPVGTIVEYGELFDYVGSMVFNSIRNSQTSVGDLYRDEAMANVVALLQAQDDSIEPAPKRKALDTPPPHYSFTKLTKSLPDITEPAQYDMNKAKNLLKKQKAEIETELSAIDENQNQFAAKMLRRALELTVQSLHTTSGFLVDEYLEYSCTFCDRSLQENGISAKFHSLKNGKKTGTIAFEICLPNELSIMSGVIRGDTENWNHTVSSQKFNRSKAITTFRGQDAQIKVYFEPKNKMKASTLVETIPLRLIDLMAKNVINATVTTTVGSLSFSLSISSPLAGPTSVLVRQSISVCPRVLAKHLLPENQYFQPVVTNQESSDKRKQAKKAVTK